MPIAINGTGTITGITAGGLPDGVITTDDIAAGAVTTAKITGGPTFSAYSGSNQAIANSTFVKLQFDVKEFDTASCFSTSTYRFTPNVAGYYQLTACMNINATTGVAITSFYKNGSEFKRGGQTPFGGANNVQPIATALIYLNGSTDYIEVYGFQNSGSSQNTANGQTQVYFQAFLARPA